MTLNLPSALFERYHDETGEVNVTNIFELGCTSGFTTSTTVLPAIIVPVPADELPAESVAATNWSAMRVPNCAKPFEM